MRAALILLTLDEIEGVGALFPGILLQTFAEVLAVDGGSRDGTREFLQEHGIPVVVQERPGRGEAFRVGEAHTTAEALVYFSPDGNEDPRDLPELVRMLQDGHHLAIASRFLPGARNEEDDQVFPLRAWVNRAFSFLANLFFRKRGPVVTDCINGFRAVRRDAFRALRLDATGFEIEYQMTIRALKAGMRIGELPTREGPRIGGRVKAASWPVGWRTLGVLARELLSREAYRVPEGLL